MIVDLLAAIAITFAVLALPFAVRSFQRKRLKAPTGGFGQRGNAWRFTLPKMSEYLPSDEAALAQQPPAVPPGLPALVEAEYVRVLSTIDGIRCHEGYLGCVSEGAASRLGLRVEKTVNGSVSSFAPFAIVVTEVGPQVATSVCLNCLPSSVALSRSDVDPWEDPTVVALLRLPLPVRGLERLVAGLEVVYGAGLVIGPGSGVVAVHRPTPVEEAE